MQPKPKPLFVVSATSNLDRVRNVALAGVNGERFAKAVLKPLGLRRADVDVVSVSEFKTYHERPPGVVVALGLAPSVALGKLADVHLPGVIGQNADKRDSAALDQGLASLAALLQPKGQVDTLRVCKQRTEKQIVYGVVLDPYMVDAQGDLTPPAEVEATAHAWLAQSRQIGNAHKALAEGAAVVESWLHPYPTPADYQAAMTGQRHQAYISKFGTDFVRSGSWLLGVQLPDDLWALVQAGSLNAFSIGGTGRRETFGIYSQPIVEFVEQA